MATMIPDDVRDFHTEGEERFYRFLESMAKPDDRYLAWYLPDVNGVEPDFVLYCEDVGLIIFEVKDWVLSQIRGANPKQFLIKDGDRLESRRNPFNQAKDYFHRILDRIRNDGNLISRDPAHHGNPKVPFSCGVVLPNINKFEYMRYGLREVIPIDKIFFWEDLHPSSDLCSDPSGRRFREELQKRFPPLFPFRLTPTEIGHLRRLLFPEVVIELPERRPADSCTKQQEQLRLLDQHQEAFARKWDGGHRIITGRSGSGKTLVLVHKAALLLRYNPKVKSILFLCYNITLVNYVRRLLASKGVPLGKDGVEVLHFFELCARLTGEVVQYENQDQSYYDLVVEMALSRPEQGSPRYDAILVDEGQDFTDDMLRVVTGLLNPETDNLTIALDEQQNLYRRKWSWKETGIHARGRVHRLSLIYRNTREIAAYAGDFLGQTSGPADDSPKPMQLTLFPDPMVCQGPVPESSKFKSLDEIVRFVAGEIRSLADTHGYPFSEFAVLYVTKSPEPGMDLHLPALIQGALESHGIISHWPSEDYRSKRTFDITSNSVTISTIHSAKGLDWACVFLIGLDALEAGERWTEAQILSLAYVGMTRARYQLYIPYVNQNSVVRRISKTL